MVVGIFSTGIFALRSGHSMIRISVKCPNSVIKIAKDFNTTSYEPIDFRKFWGENSGNMQRTCIIYQNFLDLFNCAWILSAHTEKGEKIMCKSHDMWSAVSWFTEMPNQRPFLNTVIQRSGTNWRVVGNETPLLAQHWFFVRAFSFMRLCFFFFLFLLAGACQNKRKIVRWYSDVAFSLFIYTT